MADIFQLIIDEGPDAGRCIVVPTGGGRIGRATNNDIVLNDMALSRNHCRLFFKGDELWIADLGSSNETRVNDTPVQERPLVGGDRIFIGATVLRVVNGPAAGATAARAPATAAITVDLGLGGVEATSPVAPKRNLRILARMFIVVAVVVAAAYAARIVLISPKHKTAGPIENDTTFEIVYEKVEATPQKIFRYAMTISAAGEISVTVDDTDKKFVRAEAKNANVKPEILQALATKLGDSGFLGLDEHYEGVRPGEMTQYDITMTRGRRTHRVRVFNRVEPEIFAAVRQTLEEFGQMELGLWAMQYPADKLLAMAKESHLNAQKLYDEKNIRVGNLSEAIKCFDEAEYYLSTVEPKPDYYPEMLKARTDCNGELEERHKEQSFRAEKAIGLKDWAAAEKELQVIIEMIPRGSDGRNEQARKKLLEVQARIRAEK
jgi:hypothetical protein